MIVRCVGCERVLMVTVLSEKHLGETEADYPIPHDGKTGKIESDRGLCPKCCLSVLCDISATAERWRAQSIGARSS